MPENLFTGTIPTYFGKLHKLQALVMFGNRLSGHIPSSLGNLTQLALFYSYENKLEGSIPSSLGSCKNLQILSIFGNNLSGVIPKTILSSQLLGLYLSRNSLTGTLPMEVGHLKIFCNWMSLKTICLVRFLRPLEIARVCNTFPWRVIHLKETYLYL